MTSPEAPLLRQMNVLKEAADESLLTDAQEDAYDAILQHREDGARFINLHGSRHAGKTFLCWVLHLSEGWAYYQTGSKSVDTPTVIYDHGEPERRATRQLRNRARINGLATIVYVTEHPADELYPRVELRPGDEHYQQIADTWDDLGLDTENAPTPIKQ
jgi:hypothetical protein